MTTREIAEALANAARGFPLLGEISARDLLNVAKLELGHEEILDGFQSYAGHQAMARGPEAILHVMSGNTPHAGLQSLIRGLLLKAHNYCKIPSGGLDEIARFREALPAGLKARVDISTALDPAWMEQSQAVIVFGDDATIGHFRRQVRPEQVFIGHGHKLSLGIVFEDPGYESVPHAARDASLHDQQGCLSPHVFYIAENGPFNAREYASRLAGEMETFNHRAPRSKITAQESASLTAIRNEYEFLSANGGDARVWKSAGGTDWTVVFSAEAKFTPSPLNRVIFVKPLPRDLAAALSDARPWLSTIAIWPATPENAARAAGLGASRICRVGSMQDPPFSWHQDGGQNLAPLVRWIDFDPT
ncbi:MAG TPA: acyl-CoA reductase [Chthoniobacteraceae bacterium]|nr:acyl-CoA reductase [Chthoniobacteraceae bacterium]